MFVINVDNYAYLVPYVENEHENKILRGVTNEPLESGRNGTY